MLVVRPAASGFFGPDFFVCELSRSVFLLLFFLLFSLVSAVLILVLFSGLLRFKYLDSAL